MVTATESARCTGASPEASSAVAPLFLNPGGHLVEHRSQVGVLQFRLFRDGELVFVAVGGSAGRVYRQGY